MDELVKLEELCVEDWLDARLDDKLKVTMLEVLTVKELLKDETELTG
jgi:hypothetical protein